MEIVLRNKITEALRVLYNSEVPADLIQIQKTRKEFRGDFTLVVFPLLSYSKNTPENTGAGIGNYLKLSLIHISEPTRLLSISYAVFCLKKKRKKKKKKSITIQHNKDSPPPN